uniref:Rho-GAP domain-containing protein n=1 Tax=Trichuris muris TaxID=70415 RepID=A0A5S6QTK0_TRIMR
MAVGQAPKPAPRKRNQWKRDTQKEEQSGAHAGRHKSSADFNAYLVNGKGLSAAGRCHASASSLLVTGSSCCPSSTDQFFSAEDSVHCTSPAPCASQEAMRQRTLSGCRSISLCKMTSTGLGDSNARLDDVRPLELHALSAILLYEAQSLPNCYFSSDDDSPCSFPSASSSNIRMEFEIACAALHLMRTNLEPSGHKAEDTVVVASPISGRRLGKKCLPTQREIGGYHVRKKSFTQTNSLIDVSPLDDGYWLQETMPWCTREHASTEVPNGSICASFAALEDLRCDPLSLGSIEGGDDCEQPSKAQLRHISDDIAKLQLLVGSDQSVDKGCGAKVPTNSKSPLSLRSVRGVVDRLIKQVELQIPRSKKPTANWNGIEDTDKVPAGSEPEKALEDACTQTSPLSMSCSSSFSWRSETAFPNGERKERRSKGGTSSSSSSSVYSLSSASNGPNVLANSFNHSADGELPAKWPLTSRCQQLSVRRKSFLSVSSTSSSSSSNDRATKNASTNQNAAHQLRSDEENQIGAKLNSQEAFEEGLRLLLLASASGFDDPKFADILSAIEPFAADLDLDRPAAVACREANLSLKSASSPASSSPCREMSLQPGQMPCMPDGEVVPKSDSQPSSLTASTSSPETPGRPLNTKGRRLLGHLFSGDTSMDCTGPSFATCFSDPCLKSSDYAADTKSSSPSVGPRTWGPKIKSMAREGVGNFATKLQLKQLYRSDRRVSSMEAKAKEVEPTKNPSSGSLFTASATPRTRSSSSVLNVGKTGNETAHENFSPLPQKSSMKSSRWLRRERSLAGERHRPPIGATAKLARSKSLSTHKTASYEKSDAQINLANKRPTAIASLSVPQIAVARKYALLYLSCSLEKSMPPVKPSGFNFGVQQFFKRKKSPEPTQPADGEMIFGAPLTVIAKWHGQPLPQCIQNCMRYVEANAAGSVGVFRKSGVRSRIQRLKTLCDNHDSIDFASFQVWDVADVIKLYFRELPEPLLTNSLSETFLYISLFLPERSKIDAIRKAILLLPDENCQVLYALLHLLKTVAKYSATNQMDADNLAICFAPSLFYIRSMATAYPNWRRKTITSGFPSEKELKENRAAQMALAIMIKQQDKVFHLSEDVGKSVFAKNVNEASPSFVTSDQGAKFDIAKHYDICCGSLIKEHADKWRGWSTEGSYYGAEVSTKRAADSYPLKMWRCWTEVQAPPKEVLFRILCERNLWDVNMGCSRVLKKLRKRCDVFQYSIVQMPPLPTTEFCVLRMWETDMPEFRGGCVLVEFSVDHEPAEPIGGVQANVLASRYIIEPSGRGRSRLTHISRVELRGRSKAWYTQNFGPMCARQIAQIRDSFLLKVTHGPETNL